MRSVFWTGQLSPSMKLMVNISNALAWISGNTKDIAAMKQRVRLGYDGTFSDHVTRYDELGLELQTKAAKLQLEGVDLKQKEVLDVGCGTGALSLLALERGAAKVVCGDISGYMLEQCNTNAAAKGFGADRIDFRQLDAESLPFEDGGFV